jgi:mannose-6-phosphate isomerase-like protein (cupin superfamily)
MSKSSNVFHRPGAGRRWLFATVVLGWAIAPAVVAATGFSGGLFVIEQDADVAVEQPGPHDGGGMTTGHSFFENVAGLEYDFKKRVLHPGSGIGPHEQTQDEIYYVLSGRGVYTMNDATIEVAPGMALLTRTGGTHAMRQVGDDDLVLIILYSRE